MKIIKKDVWKLFSEDPRPGFQLPVWEENFSRQDFYEMIVKCYKEFYTRPSYMFSRLRKIRSFSEFKRKAKAGLEVLYMNSEQVAKLDLSKSSKAKNAQVHC